MNLLLAILALAGPPEMPLVVTASLPAPTAHSVTVGWDKLDSRTTRFELWFGSTHATKVDAGQRTEAIVNGLTNGIWWFGVVGLDTNNVIVEKPSLLLVQIPPKTVDTVRAQVSTNYFAANERVAWLSFKEIIARWTNRPLETAAVYRLNIERTKDYSP